MTMWSERSRILPRRAPFRRRPRAAFTLIELILVMAILTIMCAMVAPSLRGFASGRRANNAAYEVISLATLAHSQSAVESRRYRLNIDSSNSSGAAVWLSAEDAGGNFVALPSDFGDKYVADPGVKIASDIQPQSDGTYVEFKPTGRSDAAHITVSDSQGNSLIVASDSPTELFHLLPTANGASR